MSENIVDSFLLSGTKKINSKSPVLCQVRHTISIADHSIMTIDQIAKLSLVVLCYFLCIIGSILICLTSQKTNSLLSIPLNRSVNGQWGAWSSWSKCSITCSSTDVKYGMMTRFRHCDSPPPFLDGKNCFGKSNQSETCFNVPCSAPIDGQWTEWSDWSTCSKTCKVGPISPLQTKYRSCTNPAPKYGGKPCTGEKENYKYCDFLSQCPIHGQWGPWHTVGACESKKSCDLGTQSFERYCNNPSPSLDGKSCEGREDKFDDCWNYIGCPVNLQPPVNLEVKGNKSGLFNVSWSIVPYGQTATRYRIYKSIEDGAEKTIETLFEDINAVPSKRIGIQNYWKIIDLTKYLSSESFKILAVRMSSIDYWKEESALTSAVRSGARSVDGDFGNWGYWSACSTNCISKKGIRTRARECNNPVPSDGGKDCIGIREQQAGCIGMERECDSKFVI